MSKEEKEKKKGSRLKTVLVVFIVLVVLGAIGSALGSDDDKVKEVKKENNETSEKTQPDVEGTDAETEEKTEFAVGETAEQKGIQVTLVNIIESSGSEYILPDEGNIFLICEFEIVNNSDKDINISSIVNFEAYCDDYSLNQDLMGLQVPEAEGKNQLDGSVASGKKMNGVIAYQVPSEYQKFEVNVAPDFWSNKDIKFISTK